MLVPSIFAHRDGTVWVDYLPSLGLVSVSGMGRGEGFQGGWHERCSYVYDTSWPQLFSVETAAGCLFVAWMPPSLVSALTLDTEAWAVP